MLKGDHTIFSFIKALLLQTPVTGLGGSNEWVVNDNIHFDF